MNGSVQLDTLDKKILRALQRRANLSNAELAEEVGASAASCWRRIKALDAANVLGPAVRLLNPHAIGRGLDVICQVRMKSHEDKARREFEQFVASREEVVECFSMSGEWDYLLRIVVGEVRDYERFLMRELLAHGSVATSASHFALNRVKYTTAMPV